MSLEWVKAMLSGCVILSDSTQCSDQGNRAIRADRAALAVPTESEEAFEAFAVLYESGGTADVSYRREGSRFQGLTFDLPSLSTCRAVHSQTITAIAQAALRDVESMKRRALHAFIYARLNFTPLHQVGRILQLADQHKAGVRGYDVGALAYPTVACGAKPRLTCSRSSPCHSR